MLASGEPAGKCGLREEISGTVILPCAARGAALMLSSGAAPNLGVQPTNSPILTDSPSPLQSGAGVLRIATSTQTQAQAIGEGQNERSGPRHGGRRRCGGWCLGLDTAPADRPAAQRLAQ